jgi:hypothetical protein
MAVSEAALNGSIQAAGQAIMPGSTVFPRIATAVARSVKKWISTVTVNGITAGTAGAGTVLGKMFFVSAGQIAGGLSAAGFVGPTAPMLAQAVQTGLNGHLVAVTQYAGASAGVSAGSDVSKVLRSSPGLIATPGTLAFFLYTSLVGLAVAGLKTPQLAQGLANGIALYVATGTGAGAVAPVTPAPAAAAGTSISVMF